MAVNKVVYGGKPVIDISDSTVSPETLLQGVIAYNAKGERIIGTYKSSFATTAKLGVAILGTMKLGAD